MPIKGQVLESPLIGATYEIIETARDTNGERFAMKATVKKKAKLVADHIHTLQDETMEVLNGTLTIWLNGETKTLATGEKILLPKKIPHNHYNNHDAPVTFIQTATPALDFDYFMETFVGLINDGKSRGGNFNLLQNLALLKYLDSKAYLAAMPIGLQNAIAALGAPVARMLGYRAIYKKYSGVEK